MLDKVMMERKEVRKDYDERLAHLEIRMGELQRQCRSMGIPIVIVFEGFSASGKGTMIGRMIRPLDPRGFQVFTMEKETKEDKRHPYLWRYATKMPAKGRIHIFDHSWYQGFPDILQADEICRYEKQFTDDGAVLIKFFLAITKKEQKKRLNHLAGSEDTSWRVKEKDWKNNENYDKCFSQFDTMLVQTDTANAPWTIVEAMDKKFAADKILTTIVNRLEQAVEMNQKKGNPETDSKSEDTDAYLQNSVLKGVDLTLSLTPEEYKKKKKDLQKRMEKLHNQMYLQRVPVVLAFEGWDAGGKGGAIKRITQCMDARGYEVVPIASPNDIEKAHHYLGRFWNHFPKDGHMAIFDRTWYGRVLVERVEGFATEEEWKRAYQEINDMEAHLVKSGTIVLKFWMHIDKDEQEKRFKQRMETPEKQWKITDEDWRNRDKWDDYEKAVDEMMLRTSTTEAPWHIIEANSKLYARIKVLEIVVEALEKRLE